MQWVSTFASGASSLGRPRRLEVRPADSGPPSSRGKFGENSPHLLGNIEKEKEESIFGEARHSLGLVVLRRWHQEKPSHHVSGETGAGAFAMRRLRRSRAES